jgi:acetyl-CoA carboxylase biotin carboxyl carrier protein
MKPEDTQELKELIEFLKQHNIGDFELERGDFKVRIKFAQESSAPDLAQMARLLAAQQQHVGSSAGLPEVFATAGQTPAPAGSSAASAPAGPQGETGEDASLHIVKSPIVGTFYESPSPGALPFVKIGDQVENGQILCIIEAMKLMNEIECDVAGEIVKRFAQSGQPVEYGQQLFAVRPR